MRALRSVLLAITAPVIAMPAQEQPPEPVPDTQEPAPPQKPQEPKPVDPTEAARKALEGLLPGAKPPPAAPVPGAADAPEAAPPAPPAPAVQAAEPAGLYFGGMLSTQYRLRHGAGATDQDLVSWLSFDVGRAERDAITGHFAARGYADLDGTRTDDPFAGLDESTGDDVVGRLYLAHVDAHRIPHVELARAGRQDLDETPVVLTFDGVRADSKRFGASRVWVCAYAGVPVHQFEASARGDSVYGAAVGCSPWTDARVRLDWMDLRDDYLATDRHDSLASVRAWQNVGTVQLTGLYTWLDGDPRDLHLGARGDVESVFHFTADYRELLTTQRSHVTELDPFFDIALDYFPYRQTGATAGADVGDSLVIDLGGDLRRLDEASDERAFNREFERCFADVTVLDVFARGLSVTVTGSRWNSSGEDFETLAGDVEYRPDNTLRFSLGTAYDLFRYDAAAGEERTHVRTWYLRLDRRVSEALRFVGGYEYERNDDDEFHVFRLEVTWTF